MGSPTGTTAVVTTTPEYATGHPGDPAYLTSGVLITGSQVRVAIRSDVTYTFGRAIGLGDARIGAQARADTRGDLLPIAVRHYVNAPGPQVPTPTTCTGNPHHFQDLVSTENTSCFGSASDASLRTAPSVGLPYNATTPGDDPVNHGPIIALVGSGATPSNNASFRGFIALDIRNFSSNAPLSTVFYNGVTIGTTANELKNLEASWVAEGYPGPGFPPVVSPPDPDLMVGIIDGNSTGEIVDAIDARYGPGDEILAAVYSGTVMNVPDFAYTVPSTVTINTNQDRSGTVSMAVSENAAFTGVVETTAFPDAGDPAHPWGTTLAPITFAPSPMTPNGTVTWATFQTTGAPDGIYTVWIQGHSSDPVLLDHYYPVGISIGNVSRDFSTSGSGTVIAVGSTGGTGTGSLAVSTPNHNATYFGGSVDLSIEGGPEASGVLPTGIGAVSVTPSTITLDKGASHVVSMSIDSGTLAPGAYPLTLRVTGTNSAGQVVTRLTPLTLAVASGTTSDEYIDISGSGRLPHHLHA